MTYSARDRKEKRISTSQIIDACFQSTNMSLWRLILIRKERKFFLITFICYFPLKKTVFNKEDAFRVTDFKVIYF
jgi:hypothetical protein